MAVAGALEFALFLSYIWSGDDAANLPLILHGQLPGDLTAAIKFIKAKCLLIAADLKHRVCRGVHDHMAGCDFLFTKLV